MKKLIILGCILLAGCSRTPLDMETDNLTLDQLWEMTPADFSSLMARPEQGGGQVVVGPSFQAYAYIDLVQVLRAEKSADGSRRFYMFVNSRYKGDLDGVTGARFRDGTPADWKLLGSGNGNCIQTIDGCKIFEMIQVAIPVNQLSGYGDRSLEVVFTRPGHGEIVAALPPRYVRYFLEYL